MFYQEKETARKHPGRGCATRIPFIIPLSIINFANISISEIIRHQEESVAGTAHILSPPLPHRTERHATPIPWRPWSLSRVPSPEAIPVSARRQVPDRIVLVRAGKLARPVGRKDLVPYLRRVPLEGVHDLPRSRVVVVGFCGMQA